MFAGLMVANIVVCELPPRLSCKSEKPYITTNSWLTIYGLKSLLMIRKSYQQFCSKNNQWTILFVTVHAVPAATDLSVAFHLAVENTFILYFRFQHCNSRNMRPSSSPWQLVPHFSGGELLTVKCNIKLLHSSTSWVQNVTGHGNL
jgi:hypothetical protein